MSLFAKTVPQAKMILGEMPIDLRTGLSIRKNNGEFTYRTKIASWAINIEVITDTAGAAELDEVISWNKKTLVPAYEQARLEEVAFKAAEKRASDERQRAYEQAASKLGVHASKLPKEVTVPLDATYETNVSQHLEAWRRSCDKAWPGAVGKRTWIEYLKSLADRGWADIGPAWKPGTMGPGL